jgi:VCBS repeat-containing protein
MSNRVSGSQSGYAGWTLAAKRFLMVAVAVFGSVTVAMSTVVQAAAPTFDVGFNSTYETSYTYSDTSDWDEFNDITARISGGTSPQISLSGSSSVSGSIVPPNTDVLTFDKYKDGTYGRMFYGYENSTPYFTYVVDSNAINALTNGVTASEVFTFNNSFDATSATFTINVSGAADAPYVNKALRDITDNLARTEPASGGSSPRVPTGVSGGNSAFGFSYSTTPAGERIEKAFDGLASTKYLNFGGAGADVLIDAGQLFIVSGVTLVTGNDEQSRDPKTLEVYGSSSSFSGATSSAVSTWTSGATQLGGTITLSPPTARLTTYPKAEVANPNRLAFRYFRLVFPTLRSSGSMMQVSEIRIEGNKKTSEASFTPGAGAVSIMGDTSVVGENPKTAVVTITSGIAGDVLTCGACPVSGYNANWDATTKSLTITKSSAAFSSTDLTTALQSITYNNSAHTGPRNAPAVSLAVTDDNGLTSTPLTYSVGMGAPRTATVGVSGGSTPSSITYGSTVTLETTASTGSGDVSYSVVSGDCTLSGAVLTMGKQTCQVRSTTEYDGTYSRAISDTRSFSSAAKSITIAASSHTVTVGDAAPTIVPVVTGLVGTDTRSVISGLTCTTTYTSASAAGTYVSRCTGTPTATGYAVSGSVANGVVTANAAATTTTTASTTGGSSTGAGGATTTSAPPVGFANLTGGGMASRTTTTTTAKSTFSTAKSSSTTVASTSTSVAASTTTQPSTEVPDVDNGGAGLVVDGESLTVEIERVNDELVMSAGPISARVWAVGSNNEKIELDSNGHLRLVQGDGIRAEVEGFDPNSQVDVRFYPNPIVLGSGSVSASGAFSETYTIPENTPNGYNEVHMIGEANGRPVTFALSIAVGKTSGGFNTLVIVGLLGLAVALGLFIPFAIRRRRDEDDAAVTQ